MSTDLRPRFFTPQQTAPLAPSHFFSKFPFLPTSKAKCSSPNGDGQDAHYGLASLSHQHGGKEEKRLSKRSPSSENARKDQEKKNTNMRSRCSPDREQEGKDTFFFEFGGRFLDRWCSSCLLLFPSAIYSCQGDLATCFTCLHQSKASQKSPRGVANPGLQTCMQPDVLHCCSTPACSSCM